MISWQHVRVKPMFLVNMSRVGLEGAATVEAMVADIDTGSAQICARKDHFGGPSERHRARKVGPDAPRLANRNGVKVVAPCIAPPTREAKNVLRSASSGRDLIQLIDPRRPG